MPSPTESMPASCSSSVSSTPHPQSLNGTRSAFVDYATAPYYDHEAAKNPVKPVLATAALKHVMKRARLKHAGLWDEKAIVEGPGVIRLLKDILGLVDHSKRRDKGGGRSRFVETDSLCDCIIPSFLKRNFSSWNAAKL